jgi:hypothetical protein
MSISLSLSLELAKGLVSNPTKYLPIVQELITQELILLDDQSQDAEKQPGLISSPICSVSSEPCSGQYRDVILSSPALPTLPASTTFSASPSIHNISQMSSPALPISSVCSTSHSPSPCNDEIELEVPIYEVDEILPLDTGITSSTCPSSSHQSPHSPLSPLHIIGDLPPLKRKASDADLTSDIFCDSDCPENCVSDCSEYEDDPNVSPAHKASRLRGGEARARRRKRKPCPRKGT